MPMLKTNGQPADHASMTRRAIIASAAALAVVIVVCTYLLLLALTAPTSADVAHDECIDAMSAQIEADMRLEPNDGMPVITCE